MKTQAFNPFLPSYEYIPDAEPYVFGNRVYVYGSHDRFDGEDFCMNDYVCWSAPVDDLGAWKKEGIICFTAFTAPLPFLWQFVTSRQENISFMDTFIMQMEPYMDEKQEMYLILIPECLRMMMEKFICIRGYPI